jgi:hypothetical protein
VPLTDTFDRQVKPSKPRGDKHADGGGMYLLVKPPGKYWRMDYRHLGTRKNSRLASTPLYRSPRPENGATRRAN